MGLPAHRINRIYHGCSLGKVKFTVPGETWQAELLYWNGGFVSQSDVRSVHDVT